MKFYKEQYTKNIPHTHKQEKKNYITLLPLGIEEKKNDKENKNRNIYTWGCPFEYDLM